MGHVHAEVIHRRLAKLRATHAQAEAAVQANAAVELDRAKAAAEAMAAQVAREADRGR